MPIIFKPYTTKVIILEEKPGIGLIKRAEHKVTKFKRIIVTPSEKKKIKKNAKKV